MSGVRFETARAHQQTTSRRFTEMGLPFLTVTALSFIGLVLILGAPFNRPAGWDATWSVHPPGLELAANGFDFSDVLEEPTYREFGSNTHALTTMTLVVAIVERLGGDTLWFLHLISIWSIATAAGIVFLLVSAKHPRSLAIGAGSLVALAPIMLQQASDVYIEAPLAAAITAAFFFAAQRRPAATTALVAIAVSIKLTGLAALPLIILAKRKGTRDPIVTGLQLALAVSPAVPVVLLGAGDTAHAGLGFVGTLLVRSLGLFATTVEVAGLLIAAALLWLGRRSRSKIDPNDLRTITMASAVAVAFLAISLLSIIKTRDLLILPRYYVAIFPVLVIGLTSMIAMSRWRARHVVIPILLAISIANSYGGLMPDPPSSTYVGAERSREAQRVLDLQIMGVNALLESGSTIIATPNVFFRLKYPEIGYVSDIPGGIAGTNELPLMRPDRFVALLENGDLDLDVVISYFTDAEREGWTVQRRRLVHGDHVSWIWSAER